MISHNQRRNVFSKFDAFVMEAIPESAEKVTEYAHWEEEQQAYMAIKGDKLTHMDWDLIDEAVENYNNILDCLWENIEMKINEREMPRKIDAFTCSDLVNIEKKYLLLRKVEVLCAYVSSEKRNVDANHDGYDVIHELATDLVNDLWNLLPSAIDVKVNAKTSSFFKLAHVSESKNHNQVRRKLDDRMEKERISVQYSCESSGESAVMERDEMKMEEIQDIVEMEESDNAWTFEKQALIEVYADEQELVLAAHECKTEEQWNAFYYTHETTIEADEKRMERFDQLQDKYFKAAKNGCPMLNRRRLTSTGIEARFVRHGLLH